MKRAGPRVLLAATALLAALLAAEGIASVCAGRLLFTPLLRTIVGADAATPVPGAAALRAEDREALGDASRAMAAALDLGLYRAHPDPLVGYTLRLDAELDILDGHIRSDHLGLRRRPDPPARPPPGDRPPASPPGSPAVEPLRIAVLGDSVAFGFGLDDEQTLAARLEHWLAHARGVPADAGSPPVARAAATGAHDGVPSGERPVLCRTLAIPGWNHRNAVHFLLDHMDELLPDIVLYLPIGNDLMDTDGVTERSLRRPAPDIAQADPWLAVYQGVGTSWLLRQVDALGQLDPEEQLRFVGVRALEADISPESARRYADNAASIGLLAGRLALRGSRLLVVQYIQNAYGWELQDQLRAREHDGAPDVLLLPLFTGVPSDFMLPSDPHPNAATVDVMARWIAADLMQRGWVSRGAGHELPEAAPAALERRATLHSPEEVASVCATLESTARSALRGVLDWTTGEGLAQVFGGLNDDGGVGAQLLVLIAQPTGPDARPRLVLELEPLTGRPDLYPLRVAIEVDGTHLGDIVIGPAGTARAEFSLPASATRGATTPTIPLPRELRLVPERRVVAPVRGADALVSFRARRIACVER